MINHIGADLVELQAETQTIGNQMIGIEPFYFCHQPASHLDGKVDNRPSARELVQVEYPIRRGDVAAVNIPQDRMCFQQP